MHRNDDDPAKRRSRAGAWLVLSLAVLALLGLASGAEYLTRRVIRESSAELRARFRTTMTVTRWRFLDENFEELKQDDDPGLLPPNQQMERGPEMNRPPFDGVARPYTIRTNDTGFRDEPFPVERREGVPRILLLGDSISFGKGVDVQDRFSERLRRRFGDRIEVLNLGLSGCTSRCEAELLERYGQLQPELVLVQASGNDGDLALWRRSRDLAAPGPSRIALGIVASSRALSYLYFTIFGDSAARAQAEASSAARAEYMDAVEAIFAKSRAMEAQVAVFSVPYANATRYGAYWEEACAGHEDLCVGALHVAFPPAPVASDPGAPRDWAARTMDLLEVDAARAEELFPLRAYFHDIVHPNARGNAVIADQLADFLEKNWPLLQSRISK